MIDPNDSTKSKKFLNSNIKHEDLLKSIFKKGKLVYKLTKFIRLRGKLIKDLDYLDS